MTDRRRVPLTTEVLPAPAPFHHHHHCSRVGLGEEVGASSCVSVMGRGAQLCAQAMESRCHSSQAEAGTVTSGPHPSPGSWRRSRAGGEPGASGDRCVSVLWSQCHMRVPSDPQKRPQNPPRKPAARDGTMVTATGPTHGAAHPAARQGHQLGDSEARCQASHSCQVVAGLRLHVARQAGCLRPV